MIPLLVCKFCRRPLDPKTAVPSGQEFMCPVVEWNECSDVEEQIATEREAA